MKTEIWVRFPKRERSGVAAALRLPDGSEYMVTQHCNWSPEPARLHDEKNKTAEYGEQNADYDNEGLHKAAGQRRPTCIVMQSKLKGLLPVKVLNSAARHQMAVRVARCCSNMIVSSFGCENWR